MFFIRKCRKKDSCQIKASFTVEAAVIIPLILFTIAGGIDLGFDLFHEAKKSVEIQERLKKLDPVDIVRTSTTLREMAD